jgi:hypothetical protein
MGLAPGFWLDNPAFRQKLSRHGAIGAQQPAARGRVPCLHAEAPADADAHHQHISGGLVLEELSAARAHAAAARLLAFRTDAVVSFAIPRRAVRPNSAANACMRGAVPLPNIGSGGDGRPACGVGLAGGAEAPATASEARRGQLAFPAGREQPAAEGRVRALRASGCPIRAMRLHSQASAQVTMRSAASSHSTWRSAFKAPRSVMTRAVAKAGWASWQSSSR